MYAAQAERDAALIESKAARAAANEHADSLQNLSREMAARADAAEKEAAAAKREANRAQREAEKEAAAAGTAAAEVLRLSEQSRESDKELFRLQAALERAEAQLDACKADEGRARAAAEAERDRYKEELARAVALAEEANTRLGKVQGECDKAARRATLAEAAAAQAVKASKELEQRTKDQAMAVIKELKASGEQASKLTESEQAKRRSEAENAFSKAREAEAARAALADELNGAKAKLAEATAELAAEREKWEAKFNTLYQATATAQAAADASEAAAAERHSALVATRAQLEKMEVAGNEIVESAQQTELALEHERANVAQLTEALRALRAAHEEALQLPAAIEDTFQERLHALMATHEEQRKQWMHQRRQTVEEYDVRTRHLTGTERLRRAKVKSASGRLATSTSLLKDDVVRLRGTVASELRTMAKSFTSDLAELAARATSSVDRANADAAKYQRQRDEARHQLEMWQARAAAAEAEAKAMVSEVGKATARARTAEARAAAMETVAVDVATLQRDVQREARAGVSPAAFPTYSTAPNTPSSASRLSAAQQSEVVSAFTVDEGELTPSVRTELSPPRTRYELEVARDAAEASLSAASPPQSHWARARNEAYAQGTQARQPLKALKNEPAPTPEGRRQGGAAAAGRPVSNNPFLQRDRSSRSSQEALGHVSSASRAPWSSESAL